MKAGFAVFALLFLPALRASAGPVSLTEPQREKLVKLVAADPEAGKRFAEIRRIADASLNAEPNPIHFTGG